MSRKPAAAKPAFPADALPSAAALDELRTRADAFSKDFAKARYEMGEAQEFIRGLCGVYGLSSRRAVNFEERIGKPVGKGINRIDGFFPGKLLVEMKSDGKNLDDAYLQAQGYVEQLAREHPADVPQYILVSDFQNLHLYDRATPDAQPLRIRLAEFRRHVEALGFLIGYEKQARAVEEAANTQAAEKLAALHDAIKATGYTGKDLEALLVRLLFCLFADDTGLFGENGTFLHLIEDTRADGDDLGGKLDTLFRALDLPADQRRGNAYVKLGAFPYVNGALFAGRLEPCGFDAAARRALLDCAAIDWSQISPDIFGSLFQAIMHFDDEATHGKTKKRREFGAHYTSEANILKLIGPLFLDGLKADLAACKRDPKKLRKYLARLRGLHFFDPACGCGNFLVVAYRELRLLEEDAIARVAGIEGQTAPFPECNVDQFYGIEIDPSAAQIAAVALWLTDHQMNRRVPGDYTRLPLKTRARIVQGNALRTDWRAACPDASCIMGNPPFVGHQWRTPEQMSDMAHIWGKDGRFGRLDYVTAWYRLAVDYANGTPIPAAFVSTNSIVQGEQVGTLWKWMLAQGARIRFAHRPFRWNNEGRGVAAVHCVIVGFGMAAAKTPQLFHYPDLNGDPVRVKAKNINPYLVDAPDVILPSRTATPAGLPQLIKGSQPTDGGHLILTDAERAALVAAEPGAEQWLRRYVGGDELINGGWRWCLWLKGITDDQLAALPGVAERVRGVAAARLKSPTRSVHEFAARPTLFTQDRQPDRDYLGLPEVSSENRRFIPIAFLKAEIVASNKVQLVAGATLYHFGILCSTLHNAWMRTVAGRLESRYSYAPAVYNNFPWPAPDTAQTQAIATAAQAVLDARTAHPGQSLAWLYNPDTMPAGLEAAHAALDRAVDAAYGYAGKPDDAARVAFLFERHRALNIRREGTHTA